MKALWKLAPHRGTGDPSSRPRAALPTEWLPHRQAPRGLFRSGLMGLADVGVLGAPSPLYSAAPLRAGNVVNPSQMHFTASETHRLCNPAGGSP